MHLQRRYHKIIFYLENTEYLDKFHYFTHLGLKCYDCTVKNVAQDDEDDAVRRSGRVQNESIPVLRIAIKPDCEGSRDDWKTTTGM